jgi:hypothetical protein
MERLAFIRGRFGNPLEMKRCINDLIRPVEIHASVSAWL